ncbi:MAG: outer membrane beta-barrel protein [Bacteroides sp.]|jgi:hypothetical protein|nr:outer membrane beta-barrel protein [Bacteroides sp.]
MKPFDDQFSDNVRKAFDDWQEDMPAEAWAGMKARLERGGKARVVPLWPFLTKAAGIALLTGLSIFWFVDFQPERAEIAQSAQIQKEIPKASVPEAAGEALDIEPGLASEPLTSEGSLLAEGNKPAYRPRQAKVKVIDLAGPAIEEADDLPSEILAEAAETEGEALAGTTPEENEAAEVPTLVLRPQHERTGEQNANPRDAALSLTDPSHGREKEGRLAWGVSAGSMLAFAEQRVSDGPGYAAGVTAEYSLSPTVTLASGGMLTYHQFELVNFSQSDFMYDYVSGNYSSSDVNLTGNNEYEMLALEIPLNAQFNVMETSKRRMYVSTGLSSLVYLQQRFSGTNTAFLEQSFYNDATGQMELQYTTSTFSVDEKYGALSRFDFGRLLNFSLGYVILRENSAMVIEPFVKLPIGTLTSRDISLGMGGISLKYRFSGH